MLYWNADVLTGDKNAACMPLFSDYDVVCLVEAGQNRPEPPAGYGVLGGPMRVNTRSTGRGMGTYVLFNRAVVCQARITAQNRHCLCVEVGRVGWGDTLLLCVVYTPPQGSLEWAQGTYAAAMEGIVRCMQTSVTAGGTLIVGDFNARIGSAPGTVGGEEAALEAVVGALPLAVPARSSKDASPACTRGRCMLDKLCAQAGYVVINGRVEGDAQGEFTCHRITRAGASKTVIDYALCDERMWARIDCMRVMEHTGMSDHCPLHIAVRRCELQRRTDRPQAIAWKPAKALDFVKALQQQDARLAVITRQLSENALSVEAGDRAIRAVIQAAALESFGTVNGRSTQSGRKCHAWFAACKPQWRLIREAVRRGDTHAAAAARREFRRLKRKAQRSLSKEKAAYLVDLAQHKPRAFWRIVKGPVTRQALQDLAACTTHWHRLFGADSAGHLPSRFHTLAALLDQMHDKAQAAGGFQQAAELNAPFTCAEVDAVLAKLRVGASPGVDGLRAEHLRAYSWVEEGTRDRRYGLAPVVCALVNCAYRTAPPESWCEAWVVAVPKKQDAAGLDACRGIAVGPMMGKVYSKLIEQRMYQFAENQGLRADGQYGFRAGKSTTDLAFVLAHLVDAHRSGWARATARRARRTVADGGDGRHGHGLGVNAAPGCGCGEALGRGYGGSEGGGLGRGRGAGRGRQPRPRDPCLSLYAAFIDFKGAYDYVQRDKLMAYLASCGLHVHCLRAVAGMYWRALIRAKAGGRWARRSLAQSGCTRGTRCPPRCFLYIWMR